MKERFRRFMIGRYGVDQLSRFLMVVTLIFMLISMFTGEGFLYTLALISLCYSYYRSLSRNHNKRYQENAAYLRQYNKVRNYLLKKKHRLEQRKQYHFYGCPSCKQTIRIPRGRGRISITCPKCRAEFIKKS